MDFLGFSEEELISLNSHGSLKKSVEFSPNIEPVPDLSKYQKEVVYKYMQVREAEIARLKHRHNNQSPSLSPNEKNLNSQLAKVQKFVKKLKSIGDENKEELLNEAKELNLKKFITEAAHSLSESRMQLKDLPVIIEVSCKLHQSYPDFLKSFELSLKKQHKEGDQLRKRNVIRLVTELIAYALWTDILGFLKVIREYVRAY